jgi:hypothetical protein
MVRPPLCSVFATLVCLVAIDPTRAEGAIDFAAAAQAGASQRVTVEVQMGGDMAGNRDTSPSAKLPISATAKLVYDEVLLPGDAARSARYYRSVEARTDVAGQVETPSLRETRRLVLAHIDSATRQLVAVNGPLERREYDLLDTAADSLALDGLLPTGEVPLGGTWSIETAAIQALTGVDSVGVCEVSGVLVEVNEQFARCQMAGAVHGVTHGANTELEIDAVYLYDREARRVTQMNIAIREVREVGPATPGLDVVAKVRVKIERCLPKSSLTPELVVRVMNHSVNELPTMETRNERLGFVASHDQHWYPTSTRGNETALRRVTSEGLVAHGNVTKLAAKPIDPRTALDEFRSDVLQSLGKDADGVAREEQWMTPNGYRVMAVTVAGTVVDTEVEWHAYQVAPPADQEHLHRLALTFTVEKSELERLGTSDRELVDHIRLLPPSELQAAVPRTQK